MDTFWSTNDVYRSSFFMWNYWFVLSIQNVRLAYFVFKYVCIISECWMVYNYFQCYSSSCLFKCHQHLTLLYNIQDKHEQQKDGVSQYLAYMTLTLMGNEPRYISFIIQINLCEFIIFNLTLARSAFSNIPLCRPGGDSEARFSGLHGGLVKADIRSKSDRFSSSVESVELP